jgi:hypothetical protein
MVVGCSPELMDISAGMIRWLWIGLETSIEMTVLINRRKKNAI